MEDGRTKKSLTEEYHLGQGTITYWLQQRRKECQTNPILKEETNSYEEIKRLRKELAETKKENDFLKYSHSHHRWHCILCERTKLEQYQFIQNYKEKYGLRWLLRKLNISSHGYYNFLKDRKAAYRKQKSCVQRKLLRYIILQMESQDIE